jgi:hypothetical protein
MILMIAMILTVEKDLNFFKGLTRWTRVNSQLSPIAQSIGKPIVREGPMGCWDGDGGRSE